MRISPDLRRRGTISLTIGLDSNFEIPLLIIPMHREKEAFSVSGRDSSRFAVETLLDKRSINFSTPPFCIVTYDETFPFLGLIIAGQLFIALITSLFPR